MPFMSSFIDFGRRRSLKLSVHSGEQVIGYRDGSRGVQLDLCPFLFLGQVGDGLFLGCVDDGLFLRLCTKLDRIAVSIIQDCGGDLTTSRLVLLSGKPAVRDDVSTRVSAPMDGNKTGVRKGREGVA